MSHSQHTPPYKITQPKNKKVGILISIPHCGISFPDNIKTKFVSALIRNPDDTDWYLEKLYDFASEMGITIIEAVYSRWVIDLNRTPQNQSLYNDGRIITALCPNTDFLGNSIYLSKETQPAKEEIQQRLKDYYEPYHQKIDELVDELKNEFEKVIFWDAHSIRRNVKTIQNTDFPDLILGNNDGLTASPEVIQNALNSLETSGLEVKHNHPFKGGYLTRSKGNPKNQIHALQLEMSKDLYMSNNEMDYNEQKAEDIKQLLKQTFKNLISLLND